MPGAKRLEVLRLRPLRLYQINQRGFGFSGIGALGKLIRLQKDLTMPFKLSVNIKVSLKILQCMKKRFSYNSHNKLKSYSVNITTLLISSACALSFRRPAFGDLIYSI